MNESNQYFVSLKKNNIRLCTINVLLQTFDIFYRVNLLDLYGYLQLVISFEWKMTTIV